MNDEVPAVAGTGRVIWITGLPCSGKTTLARQLAALLRETDPRCIVLDGDELRPAIADDLGYSLDERRRCAWRYARLATCLARQDVQVLVATLSPFAEVRSWARSTAPGYFEVFLRVPRAVRQARDRRGLYRQSQVLGADLPFAAPRSPDLVIDDDGTLPPHEVAHRVARALATGRPAASRRDLA